MNNEEIFIIFSLFIFFALLSALIIDHLDFYINNGPTKECNELSKEKCEYQNCKYKLWPSKNHKDKMIECFNKELLDIR